MASAEQQASPAIGDGGQAGLRPYIALAVVVLLHGAALVYLCRQKYQDSGGTCISANLGSDLAEVQAQLLLAWFLLSPARLLVRAAVFLPGLAALWGLCVGKLFPNLIAYISCGFLFQLSILAVPLVALRLAGNRLVTDSSSLPRQQFSLRQMFFVFAEIGALLWIGRHLPLDFSEFNIPHDDFSIKIDDLCNPVLIAAVVPLLLTGSLAWGVTLSVLLLGCMAVLIAANSVDWNWYDLADGDSLSWPYLNYALVLLTAAFATVLTLRRGDFGSDA